MKIETPASPGRTEMSGQTILFLSLPKHDGPYTSTPWQLATQLAGSNQVFFTDHPFTFIDLILGFFKPGLLLRIKAIFGNKDFQRNGVNVILTPFVFPINVLPPGKIYNFFLRWNHRIMARRVRAVLDRHQVASLVYVNSFNFYFPDLHLYLRKDIRLNIYHCIDPMVKAFTLKHGKSLQQRAAAEAGLIICTAPALTAQFSGGSFPKSKVVPNAANFELFNRAVYENKIHPSLANISGKVLGYLGNIERRTDFKMLLRVLDILNDWEIVLTGPVERQYVPVEIFEHKRIHFTGVVPHHEAPSVVKRFDVAMIPFKCDQVSSGIYPLKLFEYMAAGKPVVSTNFNPTILKDLSDVVHTADTDQEFADFVLLAYATDTAQKRERRIFVASENTWDKRAQLFSKYIQQELDEHRLRYVAERKN